MDKFLAYLKAHKVLTFCVLLAIPAAVLGVRLTFWLSSLMTAERIAAIEAAFNRLGPFGWVAMAAFHMARVLFPFLPAEPFELLAGAMYGWLGGLVNCMAGIVVGSLIVFLMIRRYGDRVMVRLFSQDRLARYAYLKDWPALDKITFLIFFLPGTPKDFYTYIVGLTNMPLGRFLCYVAFARIPSVITSTIAGAVVMDGQLWLGIFVYGVTAIIAVTGYLFHERVLGKKIH